MPIAGSGQNPAPETIARVKASIVAVGTFQRLRNPQFSFAGTGFAVRNGLQIVTNEHVLPKTIDAGRNETLDELTVDRLYRLAAESFRNLKETDVKPPGALCA